MSADGPRCRATNARGEPCKAPPALVDAETGLCPAHRPGGRERLRLAGLRGAQAVHGQSEPKGLDPGELPALKGHGDAKAWLEAIGRAVATGRLQDRPAQAAIRAVSEWVKAHEGQLVSEDVEALRARLEELEREIGRPALSRAK